MILQRQNPAVRYGFVRRDHTREIDVVIVALFDSDGQVGQPSGLLRQDGGGGGLATIGGAARAGQKESADAGHAEQRES
jgi:hypothetical protein